MPSQQQPGNQTLSTWALQDVAEALHVRSIQKPASDSECIALIYCPCAFRSLNNFFPYASATVRRVLFFQKMYLPDVIVELQTLS